MTWRKLANNLWAQYLALSLAVMLPLFLPGFILTLDLVFTPKLDWPVALSNTYVFEAILHVLNWLIPTELIEKILLLLVLLLSGVGAHKLVKHLASDKKYIYWGAYFAGMLYMINPFVYSRFMAGQHLVLLGYALTPFFVIALLKFLDAPNWRRALALVAWVTVIVGLSVHHVGILLILTALIVLAMVWNKRKKPQYIKKVAVFGVAVFGAVLLANSYWLVPTLLGDTSISRATANFDSAQHQAFETNGGGVVGALGNVLRLQGFWADAQGMYLLPQQVVPAWGLTVLVIWYLVGTGTLRAWRERSAAVLAIGASGLVAIVLAATPVVAWASQYVPFVSGYREPQKFVAVLVLAFVVLGAIGVAELVGWASRRSSTLLINGVVGLVLILPIICTPTMLWGFGGQLAPKQYPQDWYQMNDDLNGKAKATKVLFLPWHQYINFSFSERIIANPAAKFFDRPTAVGDNPEYKGIAPTVPNELNRRIEQEVLAVGNDTTRLGHNLANLGFSHVILAKEYDYQGYGYLDRQEDLQLVSVTDTLRLYEVKGAADE